MWYIRVMTTTVMANPIFLRSSDLAVAVVKQMYISLMEQTVINHSLHKLLPRKAKQARIMHGPLYSVITTLTEYPIYTLFSNPAQDREKLNYISSMALTSINHS